VNDSAALGDLLAKQQIMDAMARYARGIDRRDEALVRSAYHEDAVDHHGFGNDSSGWGLAAKVRTDGTGFPLEWESTMHVLGQHYIEVHGETATSEVYFVSTSWLRDPEGTPWRLVSQGRYLDRWERRDGAFRILERTVVYDGEVHCDAQRSAWPGPDHAVPKGIWDGAAIPDEAVETTVFGRNDDGDHSYTLFPSQAD
jgi:hypothetical protein